MLLFSLMPAPPRASAQSGSNRLVLAFYYTWYSTDVWTGGKTSDIAAQPYNSTDPNAIARQVDQARGAGIDGFVASWYGPDGGVNNQTQSNFLQLLNIAGGRGFHAAVDFETYSPFFGDAGAVVNALKYAIGTLGANPAYLRYNGKPVIFFWANNRFSPDQWANIRAQADPNHNSIWIAEGVTTQWLSVFDGLHLYNVAWSNDFAATASKFAKASRDLGKVWVATAMPGWDDTRVPGRGGAYAKDRAGGQFYRNSFAGAAASNPDMLIITSFNEWMEGSQIEPSTSYGNLYLDLTRQFTGAYKQGAPPPPPPAVQAPVSTVTSAPTESPPVATAIPATAKPTKTDVPATATPAPTPEFDTPVAYVAARLLEPTATTIPTASPTPQPSPTMIVVTLAPETLTQRSVSDAADAPPQPGGLLLAVAGVVVIGGGAVSMGLVRRRRR
jgi:Glycosyl hydrolase family 99